MTQDKYEHGDPPDFAKWLIWLFRPDTWRQQPLVAAIAAMIVAFMACSAVYSVYRLLPDKADAATVSTSDKKVVVLMDSALPNLVYDAETRSKGGTNIDDITEVLDDLPIDIVAETTNLSWNRDQQVLKLDPDLVIIHSWAFYDAQNPQNTDQRLEMFLRLMAPSHSCFVIYTQAPALDDDAKQREWIRLKVSQLPSLANRIRLLYVSGGPFGSFRKPNTAQQLRLVVKECLD